MTLLVPEIDLLNYPLFLLASLKHRVVAYKMHPILARFKNRIKVVDMADYFDWERCMVIRSEAAGICEDILARLPSEAWEVRIKNNRIDFSAKARQELKKTIEELSFLNHIVEFYKGNEEDARIISSLKLSFLSKLYKPNKIFHYPTHKTISSINTFLNRVNLVVWNFAMATAVVGQFIIALISNKELKAAVKYICDGITPREISTDSDRITFSWIADGKILSKKEVLFVLPKADFQMKAYADEHLNNEELIAITRFDLPKIASRKTLLLNFPRILKILIKDVIFSGWNIESLMVTGYVIRIIRWMPMIDCYRPSVYISSFSSNGVEDPVVAYCKAIGIKTVAWAYGSNAFSFYTRIKDYSFKDSLYYNMIFSDVIVWNTVIKEFIEDHAQNGAEVRVIGPIMSGDEDIMRLDKVSLFDKFGLSYDPAYIYIAIFDAPPVSDRYSGYYARFPHPNTVEYNRAFIKDMFRLSSDFKNIILMYKPKRSLTSGKFSYSNETKNMLDEMSKNRKAIILDYNINPWLAIAAADMCISMIFESPTIAAIHYGKAALFHDPLNIALHHRYKDFPELITHSYDELKARVSQYMSGRTAIKDILDNKKLGMLQGIAPGKSSSDRFREYLKAI